MSQLIFYINHSHVLVSLKANSKVIVGQMDSLSKFFEITRHVSNFDILFNALLPDGI